MSQDAGLTNLEPEALAAADRAVGRGGSETVMYTNASAGTYYVGVKCESQGGAEYGFAAVFSDVPFAQTGPDGTRVLRGFPAPAFIPPGTAELPGEARVFCVAPDPVLVNRIIVTNTLEHPALEDLAVTMSHEGSVPGSARVNCNAAVVTLDNHSGTGAAMEQAFVYDDSGQEDIAGALMSDAPGSLRDFGGYAGAGQWCLKLQSTNNPGTNDSLWVAIEPQGSLTNGVSETILPGACHEDFVRVAAEVTNVLASVSVMAGPGPVSMELCPLDGGTNDCVEETIAAGETNGTIVVQDISHPPPRAGVYRLRVCNLGAEAVTVASQVVLSAMSSPIPAELFTYSGPAAIPDDATLNFSIDVAEPETVVSAAAGVVLKHPRVSDLVLRLVSPSGSSVTLAENRGGTSTDGMGGIKSGPTMCR